MPHNTRNTTPGQTFCLDTLVSNYEPFQISARMMRAWGAAGMTRFMLAIVGSLVLLPIVGIGVLMATDVTIVDWLQRFLMPIAFIVGVTVLVHSLFYFYCRLTSGSINACVLCCIAWVALLGIMVFSQGAKINAIWPVILSSDERFNIDAPWVRGVTDASTASQGEQLLSTCILHAGAAIISLIWFLLVMLLFTRGLFLYVRLRDPTAAILYPDNNYNCGFRLGIREAWVSYARFFGLYASSRYGKERRWKVWTLSLFALTAETSAYSIAYEFPKVVVNLDQAVYGASLKSDTVLDVLSFKIDTVIDVVLMISMAEVAGIVCFGVFLWLGRWLRRSVQRNTIESLELVIGDDTRRPILFLRAFRDDHLSLELAKPSLLLRWLDPSSSPASIEFLILKNVDYLGPLICIGNPKDKAPQAGAARKYLKDSDWQSFALKLMAESAYIIFGADSSEGLMWEIESIKEHGYIKKTLFIFPPNHLPQTPLIEILLAKFGAPMPTDKSLEGNTRVIGMFFSTNDLPILITATRVTELEYELCLRYFISKNECDGLNRSQRDSIAQPIVTAH